jgi:hypothetical protein
MHKRWALPSEDTVYPKAGPRLRLLLEMEPGYRVFFHNLADLLWPQTQPPLFLASRPVALRRPVYIRTELRWSVFLESMAWHLAALILLLLVFSSNWELRRYPLSQSKTNSSQSQVTYYRPEETFPAREGRQAAKVERGAAPRSPIIHVRAEGREPLVAPPRVKMGGGGASGIGGSNPALPAPPLSATARSRLVLPGGATTVLAPPPAVAQFSSLTFALSRALVAPPPEVKGLRRWAGTTGATTVVAPAPALQGLTQMRGDGDIDFRRSAVVAPTPRLPLAEQRAVLRMGRGIPGGGGTAVVGPPPSVAGLPVLASGKGNSLDGLGRVVAPIPSISGAQTLSAGRGNSLTGGGAQAVAPPPTIVGSGAFGGASLGNLLSGGSARVAPPIPSFGQAHSLGGGGGSSVSGGGMQVTPPAPSIGGSGIGSGGGDGRNPLAGSGVGTLVSPGNGKGGGVGNGDALSGTGSRASGGNADGAGASGAGASALPGAGPNTLTASASAPVVGDSGGTQQGATPILRSTTPPASAGADEPGGTTRVVPLRVIELALALPTTSYFSNYEAFVAERAISKEATQLIKLVYTFLPYQRRLTEYGINTSKTFRLRVTRDPSCDESLISMTWPEGGTGQASDSSKDKLPCYRTTADDYRKALAGAR